jgi:hypothetical protein
MTIGQLGELVHRGRRTQARDLQVTDNPTDRRNYAVSFAKIQQQLGFRRNRCRGGRSRAGEHFAVGDYRSPFTAT